MTREEEFLSRWAKDASDEAILEALDLLQQVKNMTPIESVQCCAKALSKELDQREHD